MAGPKKYDQQIKKTFKGKACSKKELYSTFFCLENTFESFS